MSWCYQGSHWQAAADRWPMWGNFSQLCFFPPTTREFKKKKRKKISKVSSIRTEAVRNCARRFYWNWAVGAGLGVHLPEAEPASRTAPAWCPWETRRWPAAATLRTRMESWINNQRESFAVLPEYKWQWVSKGNKSGGIIQKKSPPWLWLLFVYLFHAFVCFWHGGGLTYSKIKKDTAIPSKSTPPNFHLKCTLKVSPEC